MKIQRSLAKKRGNIRKTSEITFLFGSVFLSVIFAFSGIYFLFGKPYGMFSPRGGNAERICAEACGGIGREEKFPSCVRVCGIDVGGMEKSKAFALIRAEEQSRIAPFYADTWRGEEVFYPYEIGFTDNLGEIFSRAKNGGVYECEMQCYLKGTGKERLFSVIGKPEKNAVVIFGKNGFSYEKEEDGIAFDEEKTSAALDKALRSLRLGPHGWEFPRFKAETYPVKAEITLKEAKESTKKISSFSTRFSTANAGRCKNVALAAAALNGSTICGGETLSFNETVGKRTRERGYEEAKIIQSGEFVSGVGGGVCQASTTLFNAALLCGMRITERRSHSLSVSYVPPSRDAMVSSESDLKITNPFPYPVYLETKCENGIVTAVFYGKKTNRTYTLESRVTGKIAPPAAEKKKLTEEESEKFRETQDWEKGKTVLRAEREGIRSELYRSEYQNGRLISRKKLFSDSYSPVRGIVGIIVKKVADTPNIFPSNVCLFCKKML